MRMRHAPEIDLCECGIVFAFNVLRSIENISKKTKNRITFSHSIVSKWLNFVQSSFKKEKSIKLMTIIDRSVWIVWCKRMQFLLASARTAIFSILSISLCWVVRLSSKKHEIISYDDWWFIFVWLVYFILALPEHLNELLLLFFEFKMMKFRAKATGLCCLKFGVIEFAWTRENPVLSR